MEMKVDAKTERVRIWEELLKVAKPDSKFSWQFSEFICDYEGSEKGTALLTATEMYKNAKVIFITPDNNLETLREQGLSASRIAAELETFKKRVRVVAIVDSLKHLQKGGRLPAAVAIVGGALGIKPVLALFDGAIHLVDKGRGRPGALVAMYRQLDKLGGVDPAYGYTLLYSDDKQLTAPVHHYLHQNLHLTGGRVGQIGPTIGTHVGPGVVGVAFVIPE